LRRLTEEASEVSGAERRYQEDIDYTREQRWPLLVDLHGFGAHGDDGIRQTVHFLAHEIRMNRKRFPLVARHSSKVSVASRFASCRAGRIRGFHLKDHADLSRT
jgi:hypothetical protein